jgi:hypothetical protein
MTNIRSAAAVKLLGSVLFASCLFPVAANAQAVLAGKFRLPYQVRWNNTVLPAGDYSITINSAEMPMRATVRSTNGKTTRILQTSIVDDPATGSSSIGITSSGNQRLVRSMNLPELGVSLIYESLFKPDKQELSKVEMEITPLTLAKR